MQYTKRDRLQKTSTFGPGDPLREPMRPSIVDVRLSGCSKISCKSEVRWQGLGFSRHFGELDPGSKAAATGQRQHCMKNTTKASGMTLENPQTLEIRVMRAKCCGPKL